MTQNIEEYLKLINAIQSNILKIKEEVLNGNNEIRNQLQILLGKSELLDLEVEKEVDICLQNLTTYLTNGKWKEIDCLILSLHEKLLNSLETKYSEETEKDEKVTIFGLGNNTQEGKVTSETDKKRKKFVRTYFS